MGTLDGTHSDPNVIHSPIDHKKEVDDGSKAQKKILEEQFKRYKAYMETDAGKAASVLADPMIAHCDYQQNRSLTDLVGEFGYVPSAEQAADFKAEYRGIRSVWLLIKTQPDVLKRMLDDFEGFDPEEEQESGWKKMTKEVKKKLTNGS